MTGGRIDWAAVHRRLAAAQGAIDAALELDGLRLEALLQERARRLARPDERAQTAAPGLRVLTVRAGGQRYGLELARLAGVVPIERCAPVPGGPSELVGVTRARGEMWAAYDLRRLLGLAAGEPAGQGCLVLLRHPRRRVGVRVDEPGQVQGVGLDEIRRPAEDEAPGPALVQGMAPGSVLLIDIDALWGHPAIGEAS
ncbi:MAG: chemotaxis protein CheW [Rhodospirillaceae bacterium]|nr:chemotaxis protein CheW [Rhodospirillaceae bacterium]